jgi:hypothetical protein
MKLFLIIIALSFSAHSATLVTDNNGQLLGINNVSINGQYWDAEFDTSTNYPITVLYDQSFAVDASQALFGLFSGNRQFDGSVYDNDPTTVASCNHPHVCRWSTIYEYGIDDSDPKQSDSVCQIIFEQTQINTT